MTPFAGLMGLINNQILMVNERMIKEIMDNVPMIERPPVGKDTEEFFKSIQLPWRTEYTPKSAPRYVPKYVRDPATRNLPPPPVSEDATSSEDLETEMSLLELEESRSNSPVLGINASLDSHLADIGILPIIYHIFEETHTSTTILLDEGSNTSLITMQVAESLGLKGRTMLTSMCKAGEQTIQLVPYTHHVVRAGFTNNCDQCKPSFSVSSTQKVFRFRIF